MFARFVRRILHIPGLVIWLPALVAVLIASLPTVFTSAPSPIIEDEWGYLLSADTFAEGRLTNETHELWQQFETIHQFHTPSYQSKYPPGQAVLLAFGQILGHPILGVWIGVALMVASIVWMLRAWMPTRWAWVGGWVVTCQYVVIGQPFLTGTFGYWSQSYWGGALAAAGGALVFGAVARILKEAKVSSSIALALGLMILANTRPMEGLLASMIPCLWVLIWLIRQKGELRVPALKKVVLPAMLVLTPGFALMGYYNHRVTGDALEMPWNTHYEQYCVFPVFLWQDPPADRDWRYDDLESFHGGLEMRMHSRHADVKGLVVSSVRKLARFWIFFIGPVFTLPLLFGAFQLARNRLMRWLAVPIGVILVSTLTKFGAPPHYSAPVAGLVVALIVQSLRYMAGWQWRGKAIGRAAVRAVMVTGLIGSGFGIYLSTLNAITTHAEDRVLAEKELYEFPGQHLVLVSYGPNHDDGDGWIYNKADIDSAKVKWARDSSPEARAKLIEYFKDHKIWTVRVGFDDPHPRAVPLVQE
ncbi:MAG: hypothetical protein P1V35_13220 [Planctomycetota bacterium]|nr:hypothetical protein [Planctomycetota bacterium]